jgi:plastocyanin
MKSIALGLFLLAACGGDDGGGMTQVDAPAAMPDAPAATVMKVSCTGVTPAATISTSDTTFSYSPSATTITVGSVVKFNTSASHDVKPNPISHSDPGLNVGFNEMACLKFTTAGTFSFICSVHSFAGMVTVN